MLEGLAGRFHSKVYIIGSSSIDGADLLLSTAWGVSPGCTTGVDVLVRGWEMGFVLLRRIYRGELLFIAGLDKLPVDEETQWLGPLLPVGGREFDLHGWNWFCIRGECCPA